jgi:acyl dehydratase
VTALTPGQALPEWRVTAINSATASENKIHDDAVARQYGFAGGLVPGVTVHGYMTRPVLDALGPAWLERGTFSTRFLKPFYAGEEVAVRGAVTSVTDDLTSLDLTAVNREGTTCAIATATLPAAAPEPPSLRDFPVAPLPERRPPATRTVLEGLDILGTVDQPWERTRADDTFLDEIQDNHPAYRGAGAVLHPGYLIRWANSALAMNVALGPWIHVSSEVQHFSTVRVGEGFSTRSRVVELFERKGHSFVVLDVLVVSGERPVYRCRHTAIYDVRKLADS